MNYFTSNKRAAISPIKLFCYIIIALLTASNISYGQYWSLLGPANFSVGPAQDIRITTDAAGTPYVFYEDVNYTYKGTVRKFNGTSWLTVGPQAFTTGQASGGDIAFSPSNELYISFSDASYSHHTTVMKFNGTNWVYVGTPGFSSATAGNTSLTFDAAGTPYVAFVGGLYASVMKFDGTNWVYVGPASFSTGQVLFTDLAISPSDTPYITFRDYTYAQKTTVMKFDGSAWVYVGTPGFSAGLASFTSIAIDATGIPYVAYQDGGSSNKATVMKYNGSSWVPVGGSAGCTPTPVYWMSIVLDNADLPYIAYEEFTGGGYGAATCMRYNGSTWVAVGNTAFSAGSAWTTAIAISNTGKTFVAYEDFANSMGISVMKLGPYPIAGNHTACIGTTFTLTDSTIGGTWSNSNPGVATIGATSGVVTAISAGADTIYYTVAGLSVFFPITVQILPTAGTISGATTVCTGTNITLSDTTTGGTWSSSATAVATTTAGGVVHGVSAGSCTISYSVTNSCGTVAAHIPFTVTTVPIVLPITGFSNICMGTSLTLTDATPGGSWASSNTVVATVGSTGVVHALAGGADTITYAIGNTCGTTIVRRLITIDTFPLPATIVGPSTLCQGSSASFTDATTGGSWSSSTSAVATISATGILHGIAPGTTTVSYTVTNTCGAAAMYTNVTINPPPDAALISGISTLCIGAQTALTDTVSGGVWSATNGVATISTGVVTAVMPGTDTILYSVTNMCGTAVASIIVTIDSFLLPATISGADIACQGDTVLLLPSLAGGSWGSNNLLVATIASGGSVIAMSPGTDTIVYIRTNICGSDTASFIFTVRAVADCAAGIEPPLQAPGVMTIWPDPAHGTFTINIPSNAASNASVTITNASGQCLLAQQAAVNKPVQIVLNGAPGIYFITAVTADGIQKGKIVIK